MTDTYNGWANYQTWCVSLWLNNEEPLYRDCCYMARHANTKYSLANELKEYVEGFQEVEQATERAGFVSDLLTHTLGQVDWYAIAEAFMEEEEVKEDTDEEEGE